MPNAPPEALVKRFQDDLSALIGHRPSRIGLAISGGADSLGLLLLAQAAYPRQIEAATVDHGLRPAAVGEARFVADICETLGVPHEILTVPPFESGNVSEWARRERYRALGDWAEKQGLSILLTAHHADDQLETMIMRLNRGSGLAGLSGIRAERDGLARPLLGWRKAELEALVADAGIKAVDDPTNRDDQFDRARLRKSLASADWLDPIAANRSASALADAEAALVWTTKAYLNRRTAVQNGVLSLDPRDLPRELLRRLTLACLAQINAHANPRGDALERLISALSRGQTVALAGVKCSGGTFWLFSLAPPRRKN
jgi:tRNA(Ile)-lysidine synthase